MKTIGELIEKNEILTKENKRLLNKNELLLNQIAILQEICAELQDQFDNYEEIKRTERLNLIKAGRYT